METLYLVRHGQASLGAADYDQLSALGRQQALRLGQYWHARDLHFGAVLTGTLRRHTQTFEGIAEGLQGAALPAPLHLRLPGLNEYDSQALLRSLHAGPAPVPDTPERYRQYFRLLCDALAQWMAGVTSPQGMPSWADFSAGVHAVLERVRREHAAAGQTVLLVSSGGLIAAAVCQVLGTSPEVTIALNMRLRNSAVTEFSISPRRLMLQTFNTVAHLDAPEYAGWVTHA